MEDIDKWKAERRKNYPNSKKPKPRIVQMKKKKTNKQLKPLKAFPDLIKKFRMDEEREEAIFKEAIEFLLKL